MTQLRNQIHELAVTFAAELMSVLQQASLSDLALESASAGARGGARSGAAGRGAREQGTAAASAPPAARGGGRAKGGRRRRSSADLSQTVDQIVSLLRGHKDGLRAEQLRAQLGIPRSALTRPVALALASKRISKKGQKRATTYFAR